MYKIDKLGYDFDALEPYIDTHTLGLHYNKHAKSYLNKLNDILKMNNYDYKYGLEELINHIDEFNDEDREDILYNLGGVLNHILYFKSMSDKKIKPNTYLRMMILNKYGSMDKFMERFKESALSIKGSGYTFLVLKGSDIDIINLSNQETPYSYGCVPLISLDMWEHAYYINYENKRDIYIDNFFEIICFENANKIVLDNI